MKLSEANEHWKITGQGCHLREVAIALDIFLTIMDNGGRDWVRLNIGNDSTLSMDGNEYHPSATASSTVEPLLRQLQMPVASVVMTKDGRLAISFESGAMIRAEPDAQCEAWEVNCSIEAFDYKFVCGPGGEVVWFGDERKRPGESHGA